jgi:hypothetical protein
LGLAELGRLRPGDLGSRGAGQPVVPAAGRLPRGALQRRGFQGYLLRIASQHEINFEKQQILDHITPGDTPTSLGYNWDLILEFLSQIGFTVDKQIVDKMRSKDNSVMKDFLSDLTDTFPSSDLLPAQPTVLPSYSLDKSASKLNSTKKNAIELSLNENFDASNEGFTTVLGSGRQEGLFRSKPYLK